MVQRLQERMPPCPELEHKKADMPKAVRHGWDQLPEGTVDGYRFTGVGKPFYMHGETLYLFVTVPLEDFTLWGENWKAGEVLGTQAGEVSSIYSCTEWPSYILEQVKAEVLAPALPIPLWAIAAIVGCVAIGGLVLAR